MFKPGDTIEGLVAAARKEWPDADPDVLKVQLVQVLESLEGEVRVYRQFHTVLDKPTRWRIEPKLGEAIRNAFPGPSLDAEGERT